MQSIGRLVDEVNTRVERFVMDMDRTDAKGIGLDSRAGYDLFISRDGIAVAKNADRILQYYGGFEYVEPDFRIELGDYVFYTAEDDRVRGCVNTFYNVEEYIPDYYKEQDA